MIRTDSKDERQRAGKYSKKRKSTHGHSNTIATFTPTALGKIKSQSPMMSIYGAPKYFNIIGGVGGLNRGMSYLDANNNPNNKYFEFGKTNYYGNYKFGRPHGTQSVHDRPVFAAAIGDGSVGNKYVTLSPHSTIAGAINI